MSAGPDSGPRPLTCTELKAVEVDGENMGCFPTQHPDRPVLMSEAATAAWLSLGFLPRFVWRDHAGSGILMLAGEER